ncbi:MAG: hypothetical protein WC365_10330 [Candidatus Babeliales bacterium]|jgi:hypothetical protein
MRIHIGGTDITELLSTHDGEYCQLEFEIKSKRLKTACGGVIQVIAEVPETPYNPLTDTDCGTDAMIGRGK